MVTLTVWPPGPYAVRVYVVFVIGFTTKEPLAAAQRVCVPYRGSRQKPVRRSPGEELMTCKTSAVAIWPIVTAVPGELRAPRLFHWEAEVTGPGW